MGPGGYRDIGILEIDLKDLRALEQKTLLKSLECLNEAESPSGCAGTVLGFESVSWQPNLFRLWCVFPNQKIFRKYTVYAEL